jgi:GT2 family glycosyltransferase
MGMSLVIASRDRADRLGRALAALNLEAMLRLDVDLVLVDSASQDSTAEVMTRFVETAGIPAQALRHPLPGASRARNAGARAARGDVLIFTDDDCYVDARYFDVVAAAFDPERFGYGGGETNLFDPTDAASGVIWLKAKAPGATDPIAPGALLPPGVIQGSNLVFARHAFERLGGFDERLGAGTPFSCEDIELCARAARAGYAGLLIPEAKVSHHHGRKPGSAELAEVNAGYLRGRGAYVAALAPAGEPKAFELWSKVLTAGRPMSPGELQGLRNELRAAADFLALMSADPT